MAAAPDFNLGGSIAFYNALWSIVGIDLSVYGWTTQDGTETTHDVGASLGINAELLTDGLYPSIGVSIAGGQTKRPTVPAPGEGMPYLPRRTALPGSAGTGDRPPGHRVGGGGKLTYVLFDGWLGRTAGYRMPFADPLAGIIRVRSGGSHVAALLRLRDARGSAMLPCGCEDLRKPRGLRRDDDRRFGRA